MNFNANAAPSGGENLIRKWGVYGVIFGVLALVTVSFSMYAPSLEPKPSLGSQLGQIAKDFKNSYQGKDIALAPQTMGESLQSVLMFVGPVLGAMAILLSVISLLKKEDRKLAAYGTGMGIAAIMLQFLFFLAVLILVGVVLIKFFDSPFAFFLGD